MFGLRVLCFRLRWLLGDFGLPVILFVFYLYYSVERWVFNMLDYLPLLVV